MIKTRDPVGSGLTERNRESAMAGGDLALKGCSLPGMAWKRSRSPVKPTERLLTSLVGGSCRIFTAEECCDLDDLADPGVVQAGTLCERAQLLG
jgi:hypothetical protein